jgi:hypothetical protein
MFLCVIPKGLPRSKTNETNQQKLKLKKMKTTKFTLFALTIAVAALSSCKKRNEAPAAPAPAETVKSFTFNTNNSAWTLDNNKVYNAILTLETIDEAILSGGAVNVYMGDGTGSAWTAMPVTQQNIQSRYGISIHTVKITMSSLIDSSAPIANPGVQQF